MILINKTPRQNLQVMGTSTDTHNSDAAANTTHSTVNDSNSSQAH